MADEEQQPQDRTLVGGYSIPLQQVTGAAPETTDMADKVQDYLSLRAHAEASNAEQQDFTSSFDRAKGNLLDMVKGDPLSTDLALSLAGDVAGAFTGHHEDDDERTAAHGAITSDLQGQIAHTAIQRLAETNTDGARRALDKYDEHLSDADRDGLSKYIDNVSEFRRLDSLADHVQVAKQLTNQNNGLSQGYLGQLMGGNGDVHFPRNWGATVMMDHGMAPETKGALHSAYERLVYKGDDQASNPDTVADLLDRASLPHNDPDHPLGSEVISKVANGITLADASHLLGLVGPQSAQTREDAQALSRFVNDARDQIGNSAAFGRFMSWAMPAYRNALGAGASPAEVLDPEKGLPAHLDRFQPTGDDLIQPAQQAAASEVRQSLDEIFAGRGRGFAMRATSSVVDGSDEDTSDMDNHDYRNQDRSEKPPASRMDKLYDAFYDTIRDGINLPKNIVNAFRDVFGDRLKDRPEEEDKAAYKNAGNYNSHERYNPAPRETMVNDKPENNMTTREGRVYNPNTDA